MRLRHYPFVAVLAVFISATHVTVAAGAVSSAIGDVRRDRVITMVATYLDGRKESRELSVSQNGNTATFRIPAADVGAGVKTLVVVPSFATARKGENGYFLMPEGILGGFHETDGTFVSGESRNYMPFYGMKTPRDTFCMIAKGMSWRYSTRVVAKAGVYQMSQVYNLGGDTPYEDFVLEFTFLPEEAEYPQMARVYRNWQLERGAVLPIRERMKKWPEIGAAATNVEIRIRQAWKPVPSPVPHQTKYNEPPVHAAVTFDRCGDIVRELKRQGVNHAEICLVGWNKGGHDGAYPQLFPVEASLGGEEKMREFIKLSNSFGFQTVCHTCFYSAYTIADDFDEEYLLKERDGSLQPSHLDWGGGRPYRTCPQRAHERYTLKNMQIMKDLGFHGLHYHDVYSILPPRICYDPRHPCSPVDSLRWYVKQMEVTRELVGGTQSEGPFDGFAGNLDFCMYGYFYPLEKDDFSEEPMVDRHVPLFQLVYHGIILSNPFTGTLNYPVKAPHKRLKFIEFGGRPLFVWYANFLTGNGNWMGKEDLTCETDEELRKGVAAIKRGYDEFEKLSDLQFEFMDDHRMLTPEVSLTMYSDGTRVVVNHGETPYVFEGADVPANEWRRMPSMCQAPAALQCGSATPTGRLQADAVALANSGSMYDVAAYVWPAYQPDPRWAELGIFADGDGEWQNVREAVPKWAGHRQPLVPLWGYENEADPKVVEKKINAAVSHGVNVFIYDWYWYRGRPFLEDALNKGFLGAKNNGKMKFFVMWANHHVNRLWNNKEADKKWKEPVWRGWADEREFRTIYRRWIEKYFLQPNYYRICGKPVLMIYEISTFVEGIGGIEKAAAMLDEFRAECIKAGLGGVHLMACDRALKAEHVNSLGIDSATIYNFVHWSSPKGNPDYAAWSERGAARFDAAKRSLGLEMYFAHASAGWDTNPRYPAGSAQASVADPTPEKFEAALRRAKEWCDRNTSDGAPKFITVNSWNEWTEGSYLEPDTHFKFGYLEAVRRVFGPGEK